MSAPILGSVRSITLSAIDLRSAAKNDVLLTTFTDAGGLVTALNWAAHVAVAGCTPTLGLDGEAPLALTSSEAALWRRSGTVVYALPADYQNGTAATNGLGRWLLRWVLPSVEHSPSTSIGLAVQHRAAHQPRNARWIWARQAGAWQHQGRENDRVGEWTAAAIAAQTRPWNPPGAAEDPTCLGRISARPRT